MESDGTDRLGLLLHDAARLLRRRFEARTGRFGLSAAQWRLLVHAARNDGVAQARLAELLEIEPISVSRLVDRMEGAGWIERRVDAADRRLRIVHPTEKARAAYAQIRALSQEVNQAALAGLPPEARRALIGGLGQIIENLSDGEPAAAPPTSPSKGKTE